MKNDTAVIWARVSSEEQSRRGFSLPAQERALSELAEKRGLTVIKKYVISESAKTPDRKEFRSLLAFIRENQVGNLLALSLDRLSRHYQDLTDLQILIDKEGLTIIFSDGNQAINRDSEVSERALFQVMGIFSEADNRTRGKKTRQGMTEKARQGMRPGLAPLGYVNRAAPEDPSGRRRTIVQDDVRAPLVRKMLTMYSEGGWSIASLREEMTRLGLKSRSGGKLSIHLLEKILKNPFYYGEFEWGGEVIQGKHEPLITRAIFDRIQVQKGLNRTYSKPSTRLYFPFRPFLKCTCGASITAEAQAGRHGKGTYVYYHCTGSKGKCDGENYRQEKVDSLIAGALKSLIIPDFMVEEIRERLLDSHEKETAHERAEFSRLRGEEEKLKRYLDFAYKDRCNGDLSIEEYREKSASFKSSLATIESDIKKLGVRNIKYKEEGSDLLELLSGIGDVYRKSDYPGKVKILSVVLSRVILDGDDSVFIWKEPFDTLALISRTIRKGKTLDNRSSRVGEGT